MQLRRRIATNPVGIAAILANTAIAILLFGQKEPVSKEYLVWLNGRDEASFSIVRRTSTDVIAGRPFHAPYESRAIRILALANSVGLVLGLFLGGVLYVLGALVFGALTASWVKAFAILATCSVQWWFVGLLLTRLWRRVAAT